MKKWAIKGLIGTAVFVALCMFFSGTIRTITTAKVRVVTAKTGKLEEQIDLTGKLVFPQTQEFFVTGIPDDRTLTVKRMRVSVGRKVKAGDTLFEAEVTGCDSAMKTLEETVKSAQSELMELERKSGDLRLKRTEENWIAAYDALAAAKDAVREAQTALAVSARLAGVTLVGGALPEDVTDEALLAAQQAVADAGATEAEAQTRFDAANRLGISEDVVTYVTKSRELSAKMADAQEQITALAVLAEQCAVVTAPYDGYVVEIGIKAGDTYSGATAAMVLTAPESKGVMRADVSGIERRIEDGTQVSIERSGGKTLTKKVTGSGTDEDGKRYIDVELTDKDITNLGVASALMSEETKLTVSYRSSTSTTLLPVSAVRGSGESRYIYAVEESSNALGERTLTIRKQNVTVLAEVGSTVSVQEDLGRVRVAYMEDRAISEGSTVMLYAE